MHHSNSDFDFDDWAGLYLENPAEFEARRQAELMLEILRMSPENAETAKQALAGYEQAVDGSPSSQRLVVAAEMMGESLQQLGTELKLLQQALSPASKLTEADTVSTTESDA